MLAGISMALGYTCTVDIQLKEVEDKSVDITVVNPVQRRSPLWITMHIRKMLTIA